MPGAAPAINCCGSLTGNRTAEFRPANSSWLWLDRPVAIMGAPAIHDGYRALANQTSSDRVVIRLLAVTYDDL